MFKHKHSPNYKLDKKNPLKVPSIDFSKWIKKTFKKSDYIVVKMNVEGAEYEVFEKMLADNTLEYINEIYVQWHWSKMGYNYKKHKEIKKAVKAAVEKLHREYVKCQTEK